MVSRRARGGLVVAGLLVALCATEAGLRHLGGVFHDDFMAPDPHRGWSLRPGSSGWGPDENTLWMGINSDGLHDREHALTVPPDTVRVAVLGDSYMQGLNVPIEHTFASFLEGDLTRCLSRTRTKAEVLNFGVSGYGTAQELLTYRHHAAKYAPAVVVLAVYTNNDIFNNSRRLNPTSYPEQSPYFVLNGDRLVLDDSFRAVLASNARQPWWRDLRILATSHSRAAQLLYETWGSIRPSLLPSAPTPDEAGGALEDLADHIYQPPVRPEFQEAWRVTEALLLALNKEVAAQGAELWIMTLANAPQVHPDPAERRRFQEQLGVESLFYPDLRIRDLAERHDVPVITLAPDLADYTAANHMYLNGGTNKRTPFGTGHWNEVGNRVAAEMASARLCRDSRRIDIVP